ncbi:hypothetical protein [Desulfobacterium sp. N47]|uniref:Uncharacterized protein n=1 Tax=uncultured Desulfobacterium sp. TaxID=201089 RepID=E1Y971_9BACT|nr:unknown protein [uncultured Desulfobacterium sp.]
MRIKLLIAVSFIVVLAFGINAFGGSGTRKDTFTFSAPVYEVEDLIAELQNGGNIVLVSGKIRNLSHHSVRGYVIIYLKNDKDKVVRSIEADVNDKAYINHGKTGGFETSVNIGNIPDIQNVVVEFIGK